MCGGILILFNQSKNTFFDIFVYHFCRIFAYIIIGVLAYLLGEFFTSLNFQIFLYFILGMFCILLGFALIQGGKALQLIENQFIYNKIFIVLKNKKSSKYKGFIFGFLNGLFPCGLVYFFIARAMMSSNVYEAGFNMLAFGLSTLIAMLTSSILLKKLKHIKYIQKILFIFIIIYGFYLCYLALKLSS